MLQAFRATLSHHRMPSDFSKSCTYFLEDFRERSKLLEERLKESQKNMRNQVCKPFKKDNVFEYA